MPTQDVNMQSFEDIIDKHEMVILDFWAEWCQPCKILAPLFEELSHQYSDIFFGKIDTEEALDLCEALQIRSVPTLMAFKKGEIVFEHAGLPPPSKLLEALENLRRLEVSPHEPEEANS